MRVVVPRFTRSSPLNTNSLALSVHVHVHTERELAVLAAEEKPN